MANINNLSHNIYKALNTPYISTKPIPFDDFKQLNLDLF